MSDESLGCLHSRSHKTSFVHCFQGVLIFWHSQAVLCRDFHDVEKVPGIETHLPEIGSQPLCTKVLETQEMGTGVAQSQRSEVLWERSFHLLDTWTKLSKSSKGDSGPQTVVRVKVPSLGLENTSLARWSLGVSQRRSHRLSLSLGYNSGYQRSLCDRGCSSSTWELTVEGWSRWSAHITAPQMQ